MDNCQHLEKYLYNKRCVEFVKLRETDLVHLSQKMNLLKKERINKVKCDFDNK